MKARKDWKENTEKKKEIEEKEIEKEIQKRNTASGIKQSPKYKGQKHISCMQSNGPKSNDLPAKNSCLNT